MLFPDYTIHRILPQKKQTHLKIQNYRIDFKAFLEYHLISFIS